MNGCLTKVEKWQDVRMVEGSDSPGLALKQACRIRVEVFGLDDLDCYLPSELLILRQVDFAHAPASEQLKKVESTYLRPY